MDTYIDDDISYSSGYRTELTEPEREEIQSRRRRRLEEAAGAVGLGAALTALRRRSSGRRKNMVDQSDVASTVPPSQVHSQAPTASRVTEKFTESDYSSEPGMRPSWRERFFGPSAATRGLGGLGAARNLFGRRRVRDDDVSEGPGYTAPPLGGHVSQTTLDVDRLEEGRPGTAADDHWRYVEEREAAQEAARRRGEAATRISDDSYMSLETEKPTPKTRRFGLPATLGTMGVVGGLGSFFKRRRQRKEDDHIASERYQDQENERLYTSPGGRPRFTGDGTPKRGPRYNAPSPITERTERSHVGASATGSPERRGVATSQLSTQEPYSPTGQSRSRSRPPGAAIPPPPRSRPGSVPPAAPTHTASPSEAYSSPAGRSRTRRDSNSHLNTNTNVVDPNTPLSPPPAVTATGSLLSPPNPPYANNRSRSQSGSPHDSNESPVASVKVKMHNDGRHVTLRRLNEEEAARERANHRQANGQNGVSDVSNGRFRRDQTPRPQASGGQTPVASHASGPSPPTASGAGSAPYDTGTDVTDFESNRRRRRAERARAEQARAARRAGGGGTGHVEFE